MNEETIILLSVRLSDVRAVLVSDEEWCPDVEFPLGARLQRRLLWRQKPDRSLHRAYLAAIDDGEATLGKN